MSSGEDGEILRSFFEALEIIRSVGWVEFDKSARSHWSNGESNHDIRIIRNFIIYSEVFSYIISGYVLTLFFTYLLYLLYLLHEAECFL